MQNADDAALRAALIDRRQEALAELYRRYSGAVYSLARRVLYDETLAEDVVQEVFVRIWNKPERFDPARGSLRSMLLADTHGRSIDLLRSEGARRRREEKSPHEMPVVASVEDDVWRMAAERDVRQAVESLDDKERAAIGLAYFGGHTYREVAKLLGEPEGTVKSRIRSGMSRLRDRLRDFDPGGDA